MKKYLPLLLLALCAGCMPATVVNPNYDLKKVKRIGMLRFDSHYRDLQGAENIFSKYLIQQGFKIVDRSQIDKVLEEQKISVQGYISPETAKQLGRVLGVDALFIGEVFSYTPEKKDVSMVETQNIYEEPVYTTNNVRRADGSYAPEIQRSGTKVTRETRQDPHVYTIYAQVGITCKLVDVETAEIIWVGTYTDEGASAMMSVETCASYLITQLRRDWNKAISAGVATGG
ncbi:MAG: CsgG/HfaB family protein [Elusimicrobiaceae bacterium]|nr:CsgG/HfaB family protein [Elusimicrobiaceae bacterium]